MTAAKTKLLSPAKTVTFQVGALFGEHFKEKI